MGGKTAEAAAASAWAAAELAGDLSDSRGEGSLSQQLLSKIRYLHNI